jgi:uncharacterized protein YoxC
VGAEDRPRIEKTGINDIDSVFAKVQGLLDSIYSAQDNIAAAKANVNVALGIGKDQPLEKALGELKSQAKGAVKVGMEGGKPSLKVDPSAPPTVANGVKAINGLVASMAKASKDLASIPEQVKGIIGEAKALPGKVPAIAKDAGLGIKETGAMVKKVKGNVTVTAGIPGAVGDLTKEVTSTFKMIGDTFKG